MLGHCGTWVFDFDCVRVNIAYVKDVYFDVGECVGSLKRMTHVLMRIATASGE